jgi:hypothetical protein
VKNIFVLAIALITSISAFGMDSTDLLPRGIHSPQFRYGVMDGADKKFDSSGSLMAQIDMNSITFDSTFLTSVNSDFKRLRDALNSNGHYQLGNALSMGTLKIDARPDVRYFAPVFARGITSKFTVAAAIPIINYTNNINLVESGNNAAAIDDQVAEMGAEVEAAFERMKLGAATNLRQELAAKGYKPLISRQESLVGDLQFHAMYNFMKQKRVSALTKTVLYLPTGKQDNPDDLADLGTYGELAIEQGIVGNVKATRSLMFAAKASYKFVAPREADVRVPESAGDALPGEHRKDTVIRDGGDIVAVGGSGTLSLNDEISVGSGVDFSQKFKDSVDGSNAGWDYALLERNTQQTAAKIKAGIEYSTTTAYSKGRAKIPFKFGYEFANTFAGKNVLNTSVHEMTLSLFF